METRRPRVEVVLEGISDPYVVGSQREIVGELLLGKWVIYLHEWLPDDTDLETWQSTLAAMCGAAGIDVEIASHPRRDMTIAMNVDALPTNEQIQSSVAAMEYHRMMESELGTKYEVLTGNPEPYGPRSKYAQAE